MGEDTGVALEDECGIQTAGTLVRWPFSPLIENELGEDSAWGRRPAVPSPCDANSAAGDVNCDLACSAASVRMDCVSAAAGMERVSLAGGVSARCSVGNEPKGELTDVVRSLSEPPTT